MPVSSGFIETITEMLGRLGRISVRKMFGGAAVYCDSQVFALLDDDTLFLKVDEASRGDFEAEGCGPFVYTTKDGAQTLATYHRAPDRLLDEPDDLLAWAKTAIAASRRAAAEKGKPKTKSGKTKSGKTKSGKTKSGKAGRTTRVKSNR